MRPTELAQSLVALLPSQRPLYIWGPPGCGKSSVVKQAATTLQLPLIDLRATLLDPVDLRGLPMLQDEQARWCPPAFLPQSGEGILFLDELAQAVPMVQAACLQLVLDRQLGEYQLPTGWHIVAASNRSEDRAGTPRLISPLLNRFVHLDLEVSFDDWQQWAVTANVAAEVRAFLRFRPNLLFQFEPSTNPRAFPTPRSWQFVSDLLHRAPNASASRIIAGCVGEGAAAEFLGFWRLYRELPDVEVALSQPETTPVPREPAVLYALVGALVEVCRRDAAPLTAFVKYVLRLPDEFTLLALRDALSVQPKLVALPAVQQWIATARGKGLFFAA